MKPLAGPPSDPSPGTAADLRAAAADAAPVGLGAFPMGVALGLLVVQSGLDPWWALVVSGLVFAGSLEFLMVGMVAAATPLGQIALAALLVNFRHVFYALSFPLHRVHGPLAKAYSTFALTDEAYAAASGGRARRWSRRRILALQALVHLAWTGGSVVGAFTAGLLPGPVEGLEFAVTALFTVLAIDAFHRHRDIPSPAAALGCAVLAGWLAPERMLPTAFLLFTLFLLARWALLRRRRR
ncbi:AzlC family ABC transporter permease [Nocardiopsis suaedae]|uniref:AzlC family ABC transporter permease n=1 Tax=Nocardiopsis suaedae TaxID=3018444 RepID=A0ABT4TSE6_9ACTN|nr:AzlC family ABC transporter permease [Nocardiopsis suaedae]MDA2807610.1 AzlC family ABC transporter permease [Nocardiopsis suaedae]